MGVDATPCSTLTVSAHWGPNDVQHNSKHEICLLCHYVSCETHWNTLQHRTIVLSPVSPSMTTTFCWALAATHCHTLQHTATHYFITTPFYLLLPLVARCVAVCFGVSQCVTACCSVLQRLIVRVAVWCSDLQRLLGWNSLCMLNLNLQSQSRWFLFNRTWHRRRECVAYASQSMFSRSIKVL